MRLPGVAPGGGWRRRGAGVTERWIRHGFGQDGDRDVIGRPASGRHSGPPNGRQPDGRRSVPALRYGPMKVHEIMTAHARCAAPDNSVVEAAGLMRELDVGVLPVCDNDRLAGMITDRDIVLRAVADGREPYETTVRDVMSPGVVWVYADQDVEEAARVMEEKQIRRLPVLNREKRMVGILSLGDVAVSSNPAFSGQALKEVSESEEEHMQGGRTAGSVRRARLAREPEDGPRGTRRIPAGPRKTGVRAGKGVTGAARATGGRVARGGGRRRAANRAGTEQTTGNGRRRGTTGANKRGAGGSRNQPGRRSGKTGTRGRGGRRQRAIAGATR